MAKAAYGLEAGSYVGSYRIEGVIGRGGVGVVYLAAQERLGRNVALKVLNPERADDESFRDRFGREARLAASLDNHSILPVYDAGEINGLRITGYGSRSALDALRRPPGGSDQRSATSSGSFREARSGPESGTTRRHWRSASASCIRPVDALQSHASPGRR